MRLNSLKPAKGARKARVRVGRGIGSGLGKTAAVVVAWLWRRVVNGEALPRRRATDEE